VCPLAATGSDMSEASSTGPTDGTSESDALLVALEHAALVESVLDSCGVARPGPREGSEQLGLARIRLTDPKEAQEALAATLPRLLRDRPDGSARGEDPIEELLAARSAAALAQPGPQYPRRAEPGHVDDILRRLRAYFAVSHAGWSPTMGKNRFVAEVRGGGGTVSHGGGPAPEPAGPLPDLSGGKGRGMTVGVLDTRVVPHPWFARGLLTSPDELLHSPGGLPGRHDAERYAAAGHATFVTGLVLQRAPGATVRVRKVLGDNGLATSWDVAQAIVEFGRSGLDVLNLSFVCYTSDGEPPLALAAAVDRLDPDVLVVACAGNHGDKALEERLGLGPDDRRKPSWPAALDDVVAVGSAERTYDEDGPGYALSPFTPPDTEWIDVLVPGERLHSTYLTGPNPDVTGEPFEGWALWGGTSFSAALLSGEIAAVAAKDRVPAREAYHRITEPHARAAARGGRRQPPFVDLRTA
jgi:membrane-anchored mycosin MYCP